MDAQPAVTPVTDRKVVRRGLLAGLAGLGAAAMLKVTGAEKAQAANGDNFIIGNTAVMGVGIQACVSNTRLNTSSTFQIARSNTSLLLAQSLAILGTNGGTSSGQNGIQGECSAAANIGVRGVGGTNGTGVKGVSNAANDAAVDGTGSGTGVHGKSGSGNGVRGESNTGIAVLGQSAVGAPSTMPSVQGQQNSTGVGVRGVHGQHGLGVLGVSNTDSDFVAQGTGGGTGVLGIAANGQGVRGLAKATIGYGVVGISEANGIGVKGLSNVDGSLAADGNGSGIAVEGRSGSGLGVRGVSQSSTGVRGESQTAAGVSGGSPGAVGVAGFSDSGVGVRGISTYFVGAVGVSTNSIGLYASNSAPSTPALWAENLAGSNRVAGYFNGNVVVDGNFTVNGVKAAAVTMPDGSQATMYCQESPEPYFEDFGRAQLVGGRALVMLEPGFASLVHRDNYMVFLTPEGDCKGLYVTTRTPQGFEVRELQGGTSSLPFSYRVVARRRDIPGIRLQRLDPQVTRNVAAMRAIAPSKLSVSPDPLMRGPGGAGAGAPGPFVPAPGTPNPVVPGPVVPGPSGPGAPGPAGGPGTR